MQKNDVLTSNHTQLYHRKKDTNNSKNVNETNCICKASDNAISFVVVLNICKFILVKYYVKYFACLLFAIF